MSNLWIGVETKLNKSGRKWKEAPGSIMPYRCAELFCEKCGESMGIYDIPSTSLSTDIYCSKCMSQYIKEMPLYLDCATVVKDWGSTVEVEYEGNNYSLMRVSKTCYFNNKGRYIKIKGKRYYI